MANFRLPGRCRTHPFQIPSAAKTWVSINGRISSRPTNRSCCTLKATAHSVGRPGAGKQLLQKLLGSQSTRKAANSVALHAHSMTQCFGFTSSSRLTCTFLPFVTEEHGRQSPLSPSFHYNALKYWTTFKDLPSSQMTDLCKHFQGESRQHHQPRTCSDHMLLLPLKPHTWRHFLETTKVTSSFALNFDNFSDVTPLLINERCNDLFNVGRNIFPR